MGSGFKGFGLQGLGFRRGFLLLSGSAAIPPRRSVAQTGIATQAMAP